MQISSPTNLVPPATHRLNLRLFGSLLGIAVLLAVGLYFLHRWQIDRNADSLLEKAEAAQQEGAPSKAIQLYDQYLKYRPNNIEAQASLGQLLDQPTASGNALLKAFMLYESVLREDPARENIRRRLADVLMRLGRFPDALGHVDVLLSHSPQDPALLFQKAKCQESNRRFPEAAASYALAIAHDRRVIDHHVALIRLVLDHGKALALSEIDPHHREKVSVSSVVEALAERMVAQGIPRARALLARSQQRMQKGEVVLAASDIREAFQLAENDPEILFAAAELELVQAESAALEGRPQQVKQHIKAAEKIAERGLVQDPPVLKLHFIIAQIALDRGDVVATRKAFENGLSHFPEIRTGASPERLLELAQVERQLLFGLADLKIRYPSLQKMPPTVGSLMDRMRQLVTPGPHLDFLLAEQLIQESQWADAIAKLEALKISLRFDRELNRRVALLLAHCYRAVGDPDARLAVLSRIIEDYPFWGAGRLEYARALADARRIEDAADEYRTVLNMDGVVSELFGLRMLQELSVPPDRRDWTRVEEVLNLASRADVDPIDLTTLQAEVRLQQKKYDEATNLLESALEQAPAHVTAHAAIALLAVRREDWLPDIRVKACQKALRHAETVIGPRLEWEMIRAEMALIEPESKAQETLQALVKRADQYPAEAGQRLLERIAQSHRQRGNLVRSQEIWQGLAHQYPNELKYWQALAQPLSDAGKVEELQTVLKQIRRIEAGNGSTSQFLLAAALLVRVKERKGSPGDLELATQMLADTARRHPNWAAVARARAYAAKLSGDSDQALRYFQEAMQLGDSSPEVVLNILDNLSRRGKYDEAMQLARRLVSEGSTIFTGEAGRFARALALQQQDAKGAVQFAENVWRESGHYWDQLWLAEMRFQSGERGPAVDELFREAVKQAPEEPATWLALIRHLHRTDQFAQARAMIAEAEKNLPSEQIALTLAQCYETLGSFEEAGKWYDRAVQSASGDVSRLKAAALFQDRIGNHDQAQAYLNQIAQQSTGASPSDMTWTRRNQALLLAAEGGYDRSIQAVKLLERNDSRKPAEIVENLKAKAIILCQRPLRKDRLEAIQVFQEIEKHQGYLAPEQQLQLARLYEATGQWLKGKKAYQQIVTSDAVKPDYLAEFAVSLMRHEETAQAVPWVGMLQKIAPESFLTATTQSRFNHSMGNSQLALTTLKSWLKTHRPSELEIQVRRLPQQSQFEQALASLLASPPKLNQKTRHLLNEAKELVEQSQPEEARSVVHQFVMQEDLLHQRYAEQLGTSAMLLEELGLFEGAEELYRDYAAFSGQPQATFVLAKFLSRQRRIEEALDLCAQVRDRAHPELLAAASVSVLGRSGIVGSREISPEQFRRVESWVQSAMASTAQSPACIVALADLRLLEQRLAEAEALYLKVLPANDRHVVALNNLAWLKAFLHDKPPEALRWINRAIEVAGPRADLLDTRAVIHILTRRADEAIHDLELALNETSFAIGHLHLAEAKALQGKFEAAQQHLEKARQMQLSEDRLHPLEKQLYDRLIYQLPNERKNTNKNQARVSLTP